jgi:hypothetical protein
VSVNGTATGAPITNFQANTQVHFELGASSPFNSGQNCIGVVVHNDGGPTGLNINGTVSFGF